MAYVETEPNVNIRDKVLLIVHDRKTGGLSRYFSRVERISDDGILVTVPMPGENLELLRPGMPVYIAVKDREKRRHFKSRVLFRKDEGLPRFLLAFPRVGKGEFSTRRRYFRVITRIPATLYRAGGIASRPMIGTIRNISAGGCCMLLRTHIEANAPITLNFELSYSMNRESPDIDRELHQIPGIVRKVHIHREGGAGSGESETLYKLGIEFVNLGDTARTWLMQFVAFMEREAIRRKAH